jgi:crotonobetainyl-CoA:carnitine CoA-transferase CaiB-like acyl-CoA transferase
MGDLGNGFLAAIGIVEALYHRMRTGEGQFVETSILNACLATSSGTFAFPDGTGPDRPQLDAMQLGFHALYRLYPTADGWICLAALTQDHWRRLCVGIARPDLTDDERFVDADARAANDDDLAKLLEDVFAGDSAKAWFVALDHAGVPIEISAPGSWTAPADTPFLTFSVTPASVSGDAPPLGAHTDEILAELRLPDDVLVAIHHECAIRARG